MDSIWDLVTYRATPCLPHQAYIQDMAKLGLVDINPELLQEMNDRSKHKQQFNMEAMQKVADHMNLKPCEGLWPLQLILTQQTGINRFAPSYQCR
jgi:hypothetical protein